MSNVFEETREKYKPNSIDFLLIAESPPAERSNRFFYFEGVNKQDSLFIETMKVLYPECAANIPNLRKNKKRYLEKFMNDGFYIIDAVTVPLEKSSRSYKLIKIKEALADLKVRVQNIINNHTKIILISSTVYEVCYESLKTFGFNIINSKMIEFPGSGQQRKYRNKLFELIAKYKNIEKDRVIWPDTFQDWDKLIVQCDYIEGWSEEAKIEAQEAFGFLKNELGEHFLLETWNEKHPLQNYIANMVPWTRNVIAKYSAELRCLKSQNNYESVLKRFKNPKNFSEATTILETASLLHLVGFDITIDPVVKINDKPKMPDYKIINPYNGEELFVEVSASITPKNQIDANIAFDIVSNRLIFSSKLISYSCIIHSYIAPKHLEEILTRIDEAIYIARNDGNLHEIVEEKLIELAVAPKCKEDLVKKWAMNRGLQYGTLVGPTIPLNEIPRIQSKISKEKNQLYPNKPNLLIIKSNALMNSIVYDQIDIESVIIELGETLYTYPQILFLVIYGEHVMLDKNVLLRNSNKDLNKYIEKLDRYGCFGQYLILYNKYSDYKVSDASRDNIIKAFT